MTPTIQSIQVGMPRQLGTPGAEDPNEQPWFSGFYKAPVAGSIQLTFTGLVGDGHADLKNHGGPDKAILCYSSNHFEPWQIELERDDFMGGMFGENLTVGGLTEGDVCIGDTFAIGDVIVQITQPRQPCWKLGRRCNDPLLPKMVIRTGRCGWYCRVQAEGTIAAGKEFRHTDRPHPEWTISRAHRTMYDKQTTAEQRRELAEVAALSVAWKEELLRKAD